MQRTVQPLRFLKVAKNALRRNSHDSAVPQLRHYILLPGDQPLAHKNMSFDHFIFILTHS